MIFCVHKWTVDSGLWTVDCGLWTVDCGLWTVDCGQWTVDSGQWTVDSGGIAYPQRKAAELRWAFRLAHPMSVFRGEKPMATTIYSH